MGPNTLCFHEEDLGLGVSPKAKPSILVAQAALIRAKLARFDEHGVFLLVRRPDSGPAQPDDAADVRLAAGAPSAAARSSAGPPTALEEARAVERRKREEQKAELATMKEVRRLLQESRF
jgi:hypothetical protein